MNQFDIVRNGPTGGNEREAATQLALVSHDNSDVGGHHRRLKKVRTIVHKEPLKVIVYNLTLTSRIQLGMLYKFKYDRRVHCVNQS